MQFEIMKKAIPEECLRAFLNKNTRYDSRSFSDIRKFNYTPKALESLTHSAIGSLGYNKVILVLKELTQSQTNQNHNSINLSLSIDNQAIEEKINDNSLYSFVNKLISNNLIKLLSKEEINKSYSLFISIEGQDGNLYDTVALSLSKLFHKDTGIDFTFKNPFITRTYCYVYDQLLSDPLEEELQQSTYYFSLIKFESGEVYIHKINGEFIDWEIITQASNELAFSN